MDLKNRLVLVTGAGRGIGRLMAEKLIELGADLILVSRDAAHTKDLEEKAVGNEKAAPLKVDDVRTDARCLKEKAVRRPVRADRQRGRLVGLDIQRVRTAECLQPPLGRIVHLSARRTLPVGGFRHPWECHSRCNRRQDGGSPCRLRSTRKERA